MRSQPVPKPIKESDISTFRDYLNEVSGLYFENSKFSLLKKVISGRIEETGSAGFSEYYHRLTRSRQSKDELAVLGGILTVGETYFFRNRDHWNAFEECVMPWVITQCRAEGRHRIRIWSAGCATGEEPYTIAIAVSRCLPDRSRWAVEILGSDINPMAVAAARRGVYRENSFRGVPAFIRREYFEPVKEGGFRPRSYIRDMVSFQELNLLDARDMDRVCDVDVVFCRNVLIYFDAQSIETVMGHLHNALRPGGYLFLGHSENTTIRSPRFATISVCDTFVSRALPGENDGKRSLRIPAELEWVNEKEESVPQELEEKGRELKPRVSGTSGKNTDVDSLPAYIPVPKESAVSGVSEEHFPDVNKLREKAVEYLISDESSQSLKLFRQVLEREPEDVVSLLGTAILLAGSGSGDAALHCCGNILAIDPMTAEAYCVMALVHESRGDYRQALTVLEKAIYLDSSFSMAHFRLAGIYERLNRDSDRRRALRNTLNSLDEDDETRIRVYSGGFDRSAVSRVCKQHLTKAAKGFEGVVG